MVQKRFGSDNEWIVNCESVGQSTDFTGELSPDSSTSIGVLCLECGHRFTPARPATARRPGLFCSRPCAARSASRRGALRMHLLYPQTGSNNFNFKNWRSKNPSFYTSRFKQANPEKVAAHRAVARAVRKGRLLRPEFCESCLKRCRVHAHHDDYSQPLVVDWLCRACHRVADSMRRERESHAQTVGV